MGNPDSGLLVLLVEDDARLARFTKEYLEEEGLKTEVASDGELGLRRALSTTFDVVVLDLMLPGRDGLDVCRKLRECSDVPIIVVTARREETESVSESSLFRGLALRRRHAC